MKTLYDFSYPVHKTLLKRNLMMGVPTIVLIMIFIGTAFLYILLESFAIIPVGIILYFVAREITKKDEYLLETLFSMILQPDYLN